MKTRTIDLTDKVTVTPAAGGRLLIRVEGDRPLGSVQPAYDDIELMKPPMGRVRLAKGPKQSTLMFGSGVAGAVLLINGPAATLRHLFEALTGVKP